MGMGLGGVQELVMDREAWRAGFMGSQRVGLQRKLSAKELMLLNCGIGEDS